jgi:glutathionylspermidine synthase
MIVQAPLGDLRDPALFRAANDEFLLWDAFVAGKPRVSLAPLVLSASIHEAARTAAEAVIAATGRASIAAFSDAREAEKYGFSKDVLALARASFAASDDAQLARVDLLWTGSHFVACEVNADCPGGHNETVGLPILTRRASYASPERLAGLADPTEVVPALVARIGALYRERAGDLSEREGVVGLVYATAYSEDLQICAFLERELRRAGLPTRRLPVTALAVDASGDLCAYGKRIDVLYRYFPVEYMEGLPQGAAIADAIRRRRVRTIASFREAFIQSKRIFVGGRASENLAETYDFTAMDRRRLLADRKAWVVKKAFGRVGDEVFVGPLHSDDEWRELVVEVARRAATGERWVAQRFVDQVPIPTPWGPRLVTLGAYVLDGKFVGYFARLSEKSHVSHDALVVPVFVQGRPVREVA